MSIIDELKNLLSQTKAAEQSGRDKAMTQYRDIVMGKAKSNAEKTLALLQTLGLTAADMEKDVAAWEGYLRQSEKIAPAAEVEKLQSAVTKACDEHENYQKKAEAEIERLRLIFEGLYHDRDIVVAVNDRSNLAMADIRKANPRLFPV